MRDIKREIRTNKEGEDYEVKAISVIGNFTSDLTTNVKDVVGFYGPTKVLNSGQARIACNYHVQSADGKGYDEKVMFYPFELWGNSTGLFKENFGKGDCIWLRGYLKEDKNKKDKDGKTFTSPNPTIVIEEFKKIRILPMYSKKRKEEQESAKEENTEGINQIDGIDVPF